MNLEGKILGNRYEIIQKIGMGGMATVYKAKCKVLNRYVAIKILRDEFTTDAEFIKRFNVEAQAAASLSHPNIVGVYDVANEGNLYYIVMELIKGKTLKEIIDIDGILPWKWSVNVAIQIASALEVAHKNNIIHRDIKPHNIIITEDGVAKVTDFGIAKAVSNSTITAFGSTLGSVHYFSPEHAKGGITDAKSDLYSLGVVLYEMLTGKVPFDADTPVSIALKHMQEAPIPPKDINPNIPSGLNDIIMKAMQKDPNDRYSSATEMLGDLREVLKNPEADFITKPYALTNGATQRFEPLKNQEINKNKKTKEKGFFAFLNKHKVVKYILAFVLAIALFFGAFAATLGIMNSMRPKEVQIPNLVGQTQEDAKKQAEDLKLVFEVKEEVYNDEIEAGKIISQEPEYKENYNVLENSSIIVVVSKGQEIVEVPKLEGETREKAEELLKGLNLVPEFIEENNDKVEAGYVIKQEPAANEEVKGGTTIKVYVSKGIKTTIVPDVFGKTEAEAKKLINDANLKLVSVKTETDTTKNDGVVLKQSLESGKEVEEDAEITITINQLPTIKAGTVDIKLSSFTEYKEIPDPDTGEITNPPSDVEVMVKVTSQGTEDTVYKQSHKENVENVRVSIQGVGNVTVKVYIGGVLEKTQILNLNQENPVLTVKK